MDDRPIEAGPVGGGGDGGAGGAGLGAVAWPDPAAAPAAVTADLEALEHPQSDWTAEAVWRNVTDGHWTVIQWVEAGEHAGVAVVTIRRVQAGKRLDVLGIKLRRRGRLAAALDVLAAVAKRAGCIGLYGASPRPGFGRVLQAAGWRWAEAAYYKAV